MYTFIIVKTSVFGDALDQFLPILGQVSIEPFQLHRSVKTFFTTDRLRVIFLSANVDQQLRFLNKIPITPRLHGWTVVGDQHDSLWRNVPCISDSLSAVSVTSIRSKAVSVPRTFDVRLNRLKYLVMQAMWYVSPSS